MEKIAFCLLTVLSVALDNCSAQMKSNWSFRDEFLGSIENASDTVYVFDRTKLKKLNGFRELHNGAEINCKNINGDSISLVIKAIQFNNLKHKFHLTDTVFKFVHNRKEVDYLIENNIIDGKKSYGVEGGMPRMEISTFRIKWGNNWLKIPRSAFSNLYEPNFSSIETYLAKGGKILFVYLSGSDGAGSYAVKFVFNKKRYLTRLITTVECVDGYDFLDARVDSCGD